MLGWFVLWSLHSQNSYFTAQHHIVLCDALLWLFTFTFFRKRFRQCQQNRWSSERPTVPKQLRAHTGERDANAWGGWNTHPGMGSKGSRIGWYEFGQAQNTHPTQVRTGTHGCLTFTHGIRKGRAWVTWNWNHGLELGTGSGGRICWGGLNYGNISS